MLLLVQQRQQWTISSFYCHKKDIEVLVNLISIPSFMINILSSMSMMLGGEKNTTHPPTIQWWQTDKLLLVISVSFSQPTIESLQLDFMRLHSMECQWNGHCNEDNPKWLPQYSLQSCARKMLTSNEIYATTISSSIPTDLFIVQVILSSLFCSMKVKC